MKNLFKGGKGDVLDGGGFVDPCLKPKKWYRNPGNLKNRTGKRKTADGEKKGPGGFRFNGALCGVN